MLEIRVKKDKIIVCLSNNNFSNNRIKRIQFRVRLRRIRIILLSRETTSLFQEIIESN
jgi:hypothetical protein